MLLNEESMASRSVLERKPSSNKSSGLIKRIFPAKAENDAYGELSFERLVGFNGKICQ
jgi:hypothetical protein